jgi:hypothetical protein
VGFGGNKKENLFVQQQEQNKQNNRTVLLPFWRLPFFGVTKKVLQVEV